MTKKTTKKKASGWGGARRGAGRPLGTGTGPGENARINRVVCMLSNAELAKLTRIAKRAKLPLGTQCYEIVARSLRRAA